MTNATSPHPAKIFRWSFIGAAVAIALGVVYGGIVTGLIVAMLVVFEITLSADNAIVVSRIVEKLSPKFKSLFLGLGTIVAVGGMRLLFPLLVVGIATKLNPVQVFSLALKKGSPETPGTYAYILLAAHPQIAAFGGMFLLMLFLNFIFTERDIKWIRWIEAPLAKIGKIDIAANALGLVALLIIAILAKGSLVVMAAGIIGMISFLLINALGDFFENKLDEDAEKESHHVSGLALLTGKAAVLSLIYLEVIDASFSLDSAVGGLSISTDPIILVLGLGAGALFVRSLTIFFVEKGTLNDYVYLEHGAHWAIGTLAVLLIVSIATPVPEVVTGLVGVGLIIIALVTSIIRNKREARLEIKA